MKLRSRSGPLVVNDGGRPLNGISVLVVDDYRDALDILDTILTYYGAVIVTAESGNEALARLTQTRVNVIISDISMPGLSGHDFIRAVRALPPEAGGSTPAIALTAFDHPSQRAEAMRAGFQRYCVKPFDPEALVREIAHLVRRTKTPGQAA